MENQSVFQEPPKKESLEPRKTTKGVFVDKILNKQPFGAPGGYLEIAGGW